MQCSDRSQICNLEALRYDVDERKKPTKIVYTLGLLSVQWSDKIKIWYLCPLGMRQ